LSFMDTVVLGALAGLTIFLGLPFARLDLLGTRSRIALAMFSVGVLAFLFVDVMEHGFSIVESAVEGFKDGDGSLGRAVGLAFLLGAGFAAGTAGLAALEARMRPGKGGLPPIAGGSPELTVDDAIAMEREATAARARALRTGMTIAAAIGLHNFAEGLAIGQSAAKGAIDFAVLLIIGFGVHNATEGFGIVAPMAADHEVPSWSFLALLGVIAGGPTFLGTVIGESFVNETVDIVFLALAAGSILYVVVQLLQVALKLDRRMQLMWGLFAGVMFGYGTELVLVAAGL
jgi:zinc transporter, ZIP family